VGRAILAEMIDDTRRALGPGFKKRVLDVYLRRRVVTVTNERPKVTGLVTQKG